MTSECCLGANPACAVRCLVERSVKAERVALKAVEEATRDVADAYVRHGDSVAKENWRTGPSILRELIDAAGRARIALIALDRIRKPDDGKKGKPAL